MLTKEAFPACDRERRDYMIANSNRVNFGANFEYLAGELMSHDEARGGFLMSPKNVQFTTTHQSCP